MKTKPRPEPDQKTSQAPRDRSWYLWVIGILVAAVLPYLPSLYYGMAVDDKILIAGYPLSHGLGNFREAFTHEFVPQGIIPASFYRPLIIASFQANYSIAGESPMVYHATNILLNVLLALLVFALARKLTGKTPLSAIAAVLFTVLPSHAESVAWISGRTDLMSTLFMLAALLIFVDSRQQEKFSWYRAVFCSLMFLCALFSKENALIFPLLVLLYVYVFGVKISRKEALNWTFALFPSLVLYMVLRKGALGVALQQEDFFFLLKERLMGVGLLYASYLRMLFVPQQVHVVYDVIYLVIKQPALAVAGWLAPIGLVVLAWKTRRAAPLISFGAGWILITLLPVVNIAPSPTNLPADRFSFLASVGSSIILGWAFVRLYQYRPQNLRVLPMVTCLMLCWLVLYCAALTVVGGRIYASDLAWAQAVNEANPRFVAYHLAAAQFYMESGQLDKAAEEYERSIVRQPNRLNAHLGLASVRRMQGRTQEAISALNRAIRTIGEDAEIEQELGVLYAQVEDYQEAAAAFSRATQYDPSHPIAWRNLGRASLKLGRYSEAAKAYKKALELREWGPEVHFDAGLAFKSAGMIDQAKKQFELVVKGKDAELSAKAAAELESMQN